MSMSFFSPCPICGGVEFDEHQVLWPELIAAWELSLAETAYINRQQGSLCRQCGGNVRSGALAKAICSFLGHKGTLDQFLLHPSKLAILEVNEAGTLNSRLAQFSSHRFGSFPDCNLMEMSFPDESFDLVVHSDTLEHVECPLTALREIKRVLVEGGATIFTVPIIVGRLSRSRHGLPPAYHGASGSESPDLCVQTEFGADLWCMIIEAGFSECRLVSYNYPSGIAVVATN